MNTDNAHSPYFIITPSGRCPHQLTGTDEESVREWVAAINKTKKPNEKYAKEAFAYWVRHSYEISSPEYKQAINTLEMVVNC